MKSLFGFDSKYLSRLRFLAIALCITAGLTCAPARAQDAPAVQGTVTDRTTGLPIANASVYWAGYDPYGGNSPIATTDANGNYSLTAEQIYNSATGVLGFQAAGYYIPAAVVFTVSSGATTTVSTTMLPEPAVFVQGTIFDATTGAGIVSASISFQIYCTIGGQYNSEACGTPSVYAVSGTGGSYSIASPTLLEAAIPGLQLTSESANATGYFSQSSVVSLSLTGQLPVQQDVALTPTGNAAIQGTVTDRNTGLPIANASVYWAGYDPYGGNSPIATTDANGNYSLTAGQIYNSTTGVLGFQATGYYIPAAVVFTVSSGATTTVSTTMLPEPAVFVQGTISDATTGAGIVSASISFQISCTIGGQYNSEACGTPSVYAASGTGGSYSIASPTLLEAAIPGLQLTSESANATGYFSQSSVVSLSLTGQRPVQQDVALTPTDGAMVQGTVTDRNTGLPIANASVYWAGYDPYGGNSPIATTDANGNYSLTAGQIYNSTTGVLGFQAAGYYIPAAVVFTVSSGATTTVSTTMLPEPAVFVQGRVTDATTGVAIEDASISFQISCTIGGQYNSEACGTPSVYAVSGTAGSYSIASPTLLEAAIPGLQLTSESANAIAYFSQSSVVSLSLTGQLPVQQDVALAPTGLTEAVTIATNPSGLTISVDGTTAVAPQTFTWTPGNEHVISTTTPQLVPGSGAMTPFASWSDNGPISHLVVVPASPETIAATFDNAPPSITPQISGALGTNGWYISDVALSWTVFDPLAPVTSTTGCGPVTVTSDTAGQIFTCSATGLDGTASQSVTIKRDTTPPVAAAIPSPAANAAGWNNTNVTVSFVGTDSMSGSGIAACSAPVILSATGAGQSASGTCTDVAGNVSAIATATGINIDTTLPTVTISTPANNATFTIGAVVTAAYSCGSAPSALLTCVGPLAAGSPIDTSSVGTKSFAVTATDAAGNTFTRTIKYKVTATGDTTAPTITPTLTGTLGANGWYTSNVGLTWYVSDSQSTVSSETCKTPITVTGNTQGVTYTCTATSAGGTASASVTIKKDSTVPTVKAAAAPAANANGWRKAPVTVTFAGGDATSGIASCTAPVNLSSQGSGQSASGSCTNNAGLVSTTATVSGISIDPTPPLATISTPASGVTYPLGSSVLANFGCSDALSGIKTCTGTVANGAAINTATKGNKNFSVTAVDLAGNSTKSTVTYTVK